MLELILTISFSSLIIVSFRLIGILKIDELETIVLNYLFAVLWGLLVWHQSFSFKTFIDKEWFSLSLIIGVFFIITFFLLSKSTVKAGLSITAVASRMSVLIPVIAGFWIFQDQINISKVSGILLALFSFYLVFKPAGKMKIDLKASVLPFLLFLGIGTNDTLMKFIQDRYIKDDESLFLTAVFFVALIIGGIILMLRYVRSKQKLSIKSILAGFVLGSLNFGTTYFFIRSMKTFETSVLFPVVNVGVVCTTALIAVLFFKEKLSTYNWIGIFMAIIAIVLISVS